MNPLYAKKMVADAVVDTRETPYGRIDITAHKGDIVLYADQAAKSFVCIFPGYYSNRPTRRNRWVTINCVRRPLRWL